MLGRWRYGARVMGISRRGCAALTVGLLCAGACGSAGPARSPGVVANGAPPVRLVHGGVEAHLVMLDARTGTPRYSSALGFPVVQTVAVVADRVIVAGVGRPRSTGMHGDICDGANPVVRGLALATGTPVWSVDGAEIANSSTWAFAPLVDAATREVVVEPRPQNGQSQPLEMRRASDGMISVRTTTTQVLAVDERTLIMQEIDSSGPSLQRRPASIASFDPRSPVPRWRIRGAYADSLAIDGTTLVLLAHPDAAPRSAVAYARGSPGDLAYQRQEAAANRLGYIAAIDLRSGRVVWRRRDGAPVEGTHGSAAIANGVVVEMVGGQDTRLSAALVGYDEATGRVLWRHALANGQWSAPVTDGHTVYTGLVSGLHVAGEVDAVDLRTGRTVWRTTRSTVGIHDREPYAVAESTVLGAARGVLVLQSQYGLTGLDAADGRPLWSWRSRTHKDVANLTAAMTADGVAIGQWGLFCSFDD